MEAGGQPGSSAGLVEDMSHWGIPADCSADLGLPGPGVQAAQRRSCAGSSSTGTDRSRQILDTGQTKPLNLHQRGK